VAQGEGPEFKSQYPKKEKKEFYTQKKYPSKNMEKLRHS
jgi:hypothetical protein